MGRAKKRGLDYFPVDVNLFSDTRVRVLFAKYGAEGCWLYMYLMSAILRDGYYVELTEDFVSVAAADLHLDPDKALEMIQFMCRKNLLDETLCIEKEILTSREIQETFREVKCSHGRGAEVRREYWLLDGKQPANLTFEGENMSENCSDKSPSNDEILLRNPDMSENYALKESKEKERKAEERKLSLVPDGTCPPDCGAIIEQYNSICTALPKVRDLTEPRKKAIKSALKRLGQEGLIELFRKTAASDFLSGRKNDWHATFDWILKPANLTKIIEGNYDNAAPTSQATLAPQTTDYTCGGKYVNMLALTEDLAPEDYPF